MSTLEDGTATQTGKKVEEFLLKEYDTAVELTNHVDNLRSEITRFQITFSGAAIAGILLIFDKESVKNIQDINLLLSIFLVITFLFGVLFVAVIARLRRSQLERYRIINKIRTHFLKGQQDLANVVELSSATLTHRPRFSSGSYFWILILFLLNGMLLCLAEYALFVLHLKFNIDSAYLIIEISFIAALIIQNFAIYFPLATPPSRPAPPAP
jgi:hypothetical protein